MALSYYKRISESTSVTENEFLFSCKSYVNDYLMDDKINKFICMLIIEQSTNEEAAKIYHEILFDKALKGQRQLLEWMIKIDFLKEMDLDEMVMEYYAPIVYWFHRYLVTDAITQEIKEIINQKITNHVERFLAKHSWCKLIETEKTDEILHVILCKPFEFENYQLEVYLLRSVKNDRLCIKIKRNRFFLESRPSICLILELSLGSHFILVRSL